MTEPGGAARAPRAGGRRVPSLPSVRQTAGVVAVLALVAVAPLVVAAWVFGRSFERTEVERADLRLAASLRSARDDLAALSADAAGWAARAAAAPRLQQELAAGGPARTVLRARGGLLRLTVVPAGAAAPTAPALRHAVAVRTGTRLLGTVAGEVPLDRALLAHLVQGASIPRDVRLSLVRGGRVIAGFGAGASLSAGPKAGNAVLAGADYRALALPVVPAQQVRLAVVTPRAPLDAVVRRHQEWVLAAGVATILTALLVVFFVRRGRSIRWPTSAQRQLHSLALVGDAFAATRDAEALFPVILRSAVAATRASGAALYWNGAEVAVTGTRPRRSAETFALRNASGSGELILAAPRGGFRRSDRELVHSLVRQAEVALESARLHRIVQQQAVTDELTDLANRRRFREALQAEIRRARRFGGSVGLLLIDLDEFKLVNDRFGHQVGDRVLVGAAETLRQRIRDTDLAARIGGDEFALLLPHTDLSGSIAVAEGIRVAIENGAGAAAGRPVTASVGVAVYPAAAAEGDLIAAADLALYEAKARGRNRVAAAKQKAPGSGGGLRSAG